MDQNPRSRGADGPMVPAAIVDTNVLIEFYSTNDLDRAAKRGLPHAVEDGRRRTRGTLWLAMAFDDARLATSSPKNEHLRKLLEYVPPGSGPDAWVSLVLHFVKDRICPGWWNGVGDFDLGVTDDVDGALIAHARAHRLPIVTRDRELQRRAAREGLAAVAPEQFAAGLGLDFEQARTRFLDRFRRLCLGYGIELVSESREADTPNGWERVADRVARSLALARDAYAWIWDGPPFGGTQSAMPRSR